MAGSLFLDGYKRPKKDKKKDEKKTEGKKPQSSSASRVNERASNSTFMGGGASVRQAQRTSTAPTKPRSANNQQTSTKPSTPQPTKITKPRQTDTGTGRQTTTTRHTPTSREMVNQRQTDTGTGRRTTSNRRTATAKEMLQQRQAEEKQRENERRRNRDANLNLKQTQAAASRRRAKNTLDKVDNAARSLGDKANRWEKENLSARNPMLATQRTVENQKAAERASERQQKKFEKLDKADQEAIKAKMQESSLGRTVGNATDRWIEREKGILHSSASTLADFGDMLNDEKSNKRGRIAEDYAGLLPDAKETRRQMRQAYADYADKAEKSAARLSELTDKSASNILEKKFYEAEDVAQGMISDKAMSILTGGNWAVPLFMRTYSQAKREAEKNGATEAEARVSGLMNSAIEIGTEGAGGYFGKGDKLLGKLGSKLENRIVNKFEGETAKKVASFIARWERNNIEESLEEVIGNPLQNLSENLVYRNRVQKERVAEESANLGDLGASIQKTFAENPTEVERYIAELNSPDTRDSFVKDFMKENGLDKKQAEVAADKMLDFMEAAATNDVKRMEEIRASLSEDLAGDTKKKVFDWRENLNAVLISHLVGVGSGVNAASTMAQGQAILDAPNSKGAIQNALQKTAAFSSENSAKAKGLLETMEKDDYTPTATQAYDIMANENTVMAESAERQRAAEQVKEKAIKRENLSVPVSTVRADGKHIITGEQTTERYLNRAVDTFELVEAINGSIHNESEKVSDDVAQKMADIVPSFDVGTLDVSHTAELTTDHTEERYIFKEMTGVDLNQFNVYDKNGNLDAVASNINMQKGLLAMSAQNYIESARIEQLAWNDQARGQIADVLGSKFNPQGDIAIHDALESVDPRDQSKFMLMTRVAQDVYRNAYTTTDSWQEVKKTYQKLYPSLNIDALEGMYESAKADRAEDETPYLNYEVKAGEALDSISKGDAKPQIRGKFVNETPYNAETGEGRLLAESDRIVLASMAKGINANITMIDAEDDRLAYTDEYGETQYNNASVDLATGEILLSNACDIGTAIHEVTHVGARLASRYYRDLADYIFDMAYKHDPEKTMRILDAYRRSYADQNLSEAKLKEEAVSDLVAAFQNDPRFARDMAQGDPSIIRKIINAIEDLLRSLRNILATGKIQDPAVQNSFLVEIGAYEDARKMWLRMYREAQKNSAALGIAKWHEDQIRDNRVANARHTNVEQAEKERELFFRDSDGNGLTERQAQIVHDIGPDIRFSRPTFLNDLAKGKYYANMNNGKGGFAGLAEVASGKDILKRTMQKNGFSSSQTDAVVGFLSHMADYLDSDELQMRYSFIGWQDLTDAEITVRRDKDDNIVGVAVSAMVVNGEYPVNFDMTTICNKREGVMEVIQELTRKYDADTGRTILNSIKLTDEKMWNINKALKAEGIDTACLGCFVEARRYYTNRFIDKVDDVWNNAVRDARRQLGLPEEEYFNFAKGKKVSGEDYNKISDLWTAYDESTESKRSPSQRIKILMDEIVRNKEVDSPYLKLISAEDILTPEGIDGFKRISTKDRDMVKMIKSIYGTSAPKEILAFTPYNSEIALLPDKIKGMETGEYLKSIGGTRVQSFSDFKMAHMFDHMQMVADEAARGFVNHGYSKVIAYPRLFGLTGRKINMSVMFDVLPASTWQSVLGCSEEAAKEIADRYQGLRFVKEKPAENPDNRPYVETEIEGVHGYLTYLVSDADYVNSVFDELYQQYLAEGMDEDTARREANKAKPFEQSINYREAVELENQDGYKENVGIIAVAYGNEHLRMLLDDPNVRYIIPYHRSGLPVFIAQKTALDIAKDYTDFQNTRKAKGGLWADAEGNKVRLKNKYAKWKEEHADEAFPAIAFFRDEIGDYTFEPGKLTTKEKANLAGTGTFDVYENLDKVSDIREISNAYLEHCINNNQVPIFHEFAGHPNYYKMLFDFAVTDAEGNIYPQRPVRNVYPGLDIDAKVAAGEEITEEDYAEFYKAIEEGLQNENAKNELRSNRLGKVLDEDLLSREGENSIIADSNIQHIVNGTPDYTNPKSSDIANSRDVDIDEQYMQAVNSGNMDEAQRLVDEAAYTRNYVAAAYHGTPNGGFTVFGGSQTRNGAKAAGTIWFAEEEEHANVYRSYPGGWPKAENPQTYHVYLDTGIWADIGNGRVEALDYSHNGYGDASKDLKRVAKAIVSYTAWQHRDESDRTRTKKITNALTDIARNIYADFVWQVTETQEFADLCMEQGLDSVVAWEEHHDGDGKSHMVKTWGVFKPSQVKSSDPVTYREDGSVIPLSQRFDPTSNDIRNSRPTIDAGGNILTDGQTEYFKNSQARDAEGRLVPVYHSTDEGGFTVFDPSVSNDARSLFFTDSRRMSESYIQFGNIGDIDPYNERNKSGTYTCYLNIENPLIVDANGANWDEIYFNPNIDEDEGEYDVEYLTNTREIAELAYNMRYDGAIIRNVTDYAQSGYGEKPHDVYVAFSSNQVKDTRNQKPTSDPDIRYSRTVDDEAMSHMAHDYAYDNSYEALAHYEEMIAADEADETVYQKAKSYIAKDVDEFYAGLTRYADGMKFDDPILEEGRSRMARSKQDFFNSNKAKWNQNWLTDGEVLDIKSVEKAVRDLVTGTMLNSNTNRKYSQETVKKTLMDMRLAYFYAKQGRTDIADALLWHSAHRMIDGVEFYREDGNFETYKRLRDYFKDAKLQLGEDYWNDVDYAAFRKMNFGRLNLVRGKTNLDKILDDLYHENSDGSIEGIAVEWFNPEAFEKNNYKIDSVPDILLQIADVLDTVEPYAEAYSSEYCAEWATDIASDLLDIMQSGKELQSTADKYKKRYDEKAKAMKARHAEAMLKVRRQRDEGIKREKVKLKEYVERQREKKAHAKYFQGIQKSYDTLKDRLLTNTADKNIPEQYKKDLARLLAAFDLQTVGSKKYEARTGRQGQKTIKMAAVKVALRNIENKTGEFHVSDAVTDIIDELMGDDTGNGSNRSIEGLTIDELSVSELARIDKLLKALVHEFNTYRYVKVQAKRMQVEDIGKAQVEDALNHAEKFGRRKDYQNFTGVLDKIINMGEMTPAYMFRYIDPNNVGLGMMWKEIRRSFDRYVRNQNQLNEWMDEIVGQYHQKGLLWNKYGSGELSDWRSINYQQTFTLENGHSVALTPAQIMSLYCLSKRNQAYNHMTGAGIIVAPVSFQAKVISDIKKKADMSLPEKLTDADIDKITAHLTDNQRHVADELQKLMSEKMAAWGNEASMNVLGIELFGEPDYFPIRSDKAALEKDLNADEFAQAIRNFGFTKAVQPGARNAIMIDDIFDVVAEHCNNMNLYNSYSETMNDFMKVYNYRDFRDDGREYTVQQAIAHAYSQKATTFIMTFMRDLNGNVSGRSSAIEDAYNYALGNAKKAAVFANLRVAAQQPTALVRAFAEIDPKYLKGIRVGQGDMKEMFEHCPIALWKSWGYYDINMGKSIEDLMMNNGSWLEDKATDLYGALDNVTWTAIWQMVKAETRDKHPELKEGTDEFFEHCNERMSEIVDLTQVVDSPMHRSHEMRSKGVISKLATAFMAEPTLTFNMVKSGYRRSIEAWKSGDKKKAIGIAQRTFNVFMIQAGAVALSAALVDALRHKKPDKDDEDERFLHLWWVNTIENFHDNIKLWNNIYYVKDIVSMFEGWENTNLGLQGWKNLATGWNQLTGNGYVRSSKTWYENMAYGLGYIWGIPTKTMMTGISNALNMFGLTIPGTEAVTDLLDNTQEAFQSAFQKDDVEVKPEGMAASLIGVVLSDDKSLMDRAAEKMGYKRIEASASTDKSSSSTSESEGTSYSMTEDDLPDNLTDEQKKDILKAGEKRAKKAVSEEEQEQLNYDKMLYDAMKAAAGLEGEEYNKKIYSSVAQGLKGYVADGDYTSIGMMRTVIEQAGGDVAYFDQRVMEETKSAYKKTLVYAGDMYSPEGLEARNNQKAMFRYMMNHGMTQEELSSEVLYHSELAKDMKVAYRVGDNDLIYEAMMPLVDAGITELDLERLYENRNKMDLTKYKQNGRFKDKLKSMGTFIWPTEGVITSHFGYRNAPTAGASSNHPAIDIGAPTGTPVVAADGGVVISAGANGGYGNSVGIKHDNGMITWYNHLSGWNVKVGDTVGQGQQIAQVGSTGISTGPHLDFKIVDAKGNPVDPEKYLDKR